jgi:hypothetical protein
MKRLPARSLRVMPKLSLVPLLAVVFGLAGVAVANAATPAQVLQAHQRAAVGAADHLLGEVVLPAGATEVPTEPDGDMHQLARPLGLSFFAAKVDRHEFWTTTASPSDVIAWFEGHPPAGAKLSGSGFSGSGSPGSGSPSSGSPSSVSSAFASYSLPTVGAPALGPRSLEVEAVELSGGATGIRADAVVRYSAPRLPAQRIPAAARVLEITMANAGSKPLLSLTVTRASQVRRIATLVDRLPFVAYMPGVAFACPSIQAAPIDMFVFASAPGGSTLATVSEPANTPTAAEPCFTTTLTILGHREPRLLDGGTLLHEAGAILGVKLTTHP